MKRAYSLIRFSSWKQAKGDSRRRQSQWSAAWCERNNYLLDESLKWDKPVSGFRGLNRSKGALAAFLEMVQVGRVAKGSILLLESLDRLSREQVDEAFVLFQGILKAGVEIVTMEPERRYSKASIGDIVGILEPLVIMSRANEESVIKSQRISEQWQERRKRAGEKPMNSIGPAWLQMVNGHWQPIPERVKIVRQIFRLAIDGYGLHAIAHELNGSPRKKKGQPAEPAKKPTPTMGRGKEWCYSYIGLTLRNRAVLGEYQPHMIQDGKRVPTGPVIPGYYPEVIDKATFYQAQAALDGRKNQKGPRGKYVRNLFTGILRDAIDGCTMVTNSESDKCKTVKLVSSGGQRGKVGSTYRTFPYDAVEGAFLRLVKELKASDVLPREQSAGADEVAALSGQLQDLEHRIGRTMAELNGDGEFDLGLRLLRELGDKKKDVSAQLEKAQAEASTNEAEVLGEAQSLIDLLARVEGEERLTLRTKIKARIGQLVSEIRILIVPREGLKRIAVLQIWFTGGNLRRDLLILHKPGTAHAQRGWWAKSLATVGMPDDLDMRNKANTKELETALLAIDLEGLEAMLSGEE